MPQSPSRTVRRPVASVVGAGSPSERLASEAERLGRCLVDRGFRIATGGLRGVMEAASRGARSSSRYTEGSVLAVLPGTDAAAANAHADIVIPTGMGHARNVILVSLADVVVAVGGGAGTLSEVAMAWQHGKPVVCLDTGEGWASRLAGTCLDERRADPLLRAGSAEDAARIAEEALGSQLRDGSES